MKKVVLVSLFVVVVATAFTQEESSEQTQSKPSTNEPSSVLVKLHNHSFRQHELTILDRVSTSSVLFGTTSFCMAVGQQLHFTHQGENYLLMTASDKKQQHYNLNKIVKQRKKELGLSSSIRKQ